MRTLDIFLLRHGECEDEGLVRGTTNSLLTEQGRLQMNQAISELSGWSDIVCSPLSRCRSFAEGVTSKGVASLTVEPGFQEIDFGRWEGASWQDLQSKETDALRDYYDDPLSHASHGGEQYSEFRSRVLSAWEGLFSKLTGNRVLIVTHGGVIKTLVSSFLGMPPEAQTSLLVPHACLTHLVLHLAEQEQYVFLQSHDSASRDKE